MAIQDQHSTIKLEQLKQKIETEIGDDFSKFESPTNDDFALFGRYIQMFGMIELNLRSAVEVFFRANLLNAAAMKT